jgi:hypothetical protein
MMTSLILPYKILDPFAGWGVVFIGAARAAFGREGQFKRRNPLSHPSAGIQQGGAISYEYD